MKIQYFISKGQWFFRIRAKNGKVIAQSEGYKREAGCLKTIALFAPLTTKVERVKRWQRSS